MESNNFDKIYDSMKQSEDRLNELENLKSFLSNDEIKTLSLINHIVNIENNQNRIVEILENNEKKIILKQIPSYFLSMIAMIIALIAILDVSYGVILIAIIVPVLCVYFYRLTKKEVERVNEDYPPK